MNIYLVAAMLLSASLALTIVENRASKHSLRSTDFTIIVSSLTLHIIALIMQPKGQGAAPI
jgi:hypothetical protein